MAIGPGIALVAIGLIVALFLMPTLGWILVVVGLVGVLAGFLMGPGRWRREVVVERERPARRREIIRERRR